jgi:signal transduction histidine kinase
MRIVWRELRIGIGICLGVAAFLTLLLRDGFWTNLVYSLCVGLTIQALIETGRYGLDAWLRHRHPDVVRDGRGWPGWPVMLPWILISVAIGYVFGSTVAAGLTGTAHLRDAWVSNDWRALAVIIPIVIAISLGATYFFYARGRLALTEAQVQAARSAAAENQLRLLESQLEPHMLFNTLANLRVLIGTDPARAQAMLDRLIAFLRATLNASRAGRHTLAAEFDRLSDYLALMGVRMGPRLTTRLDLPEALRELTVPPLLLQPLVENSIKHGLEPQVEGGMVEIGARRDGTMLVLTVRDTGAGLPEGRPIQETGFGLVQVRERLATLYGREATLVISAANDIRGGTLATVHLPIDHPTP